jgi:predicted outer membrane lipoprotein
MKVSTWLLGVLLAAGFAATAAAEIYRWVDENGQAHYGDRPPKGAEVETIRPQHRGFGSVPAPSPATTPSGDDDIATAGEPVDETERTARIRREQCEKGRERLESYRNAARIQLRQEDGGTRDMNPEERVQAIARAEADVAQLCGEA